MSRAIDEWADEIAAASVVIDRRRERLNTAARMLATAPRCVLDRRAARLTEALCSLETAERKYAALITEGPAGPE